MPRLSRTSARRTLVRGSVGSLAVIGLTSLALATAGTAVASQRIPARGVTDPRFVWTVTHSNRHGAATIINSPATNNKPHALVFVTSNWNPRNTSTGTYNNHPIGVFYDTSNNRWGIFNEDLTPIPIGRSFNVLVVPQASKTAFQVTASSLNSSGDSLFMNRHLINGHHGVLLQVTQVWNRGGGALGVYNDDNIGVWYDSPEWAIFEEDGATMPQSPGNGPSFNVLVGTSNTGGVQKLIKANSSNATLNWVLESNTHTNNHPAAMVFATPNWNPPGSSGINDTSPIGVWYDKQVSPHEWGVFNQNTSDMTLGSAFNLLIFQTR